MNISNTLFQISKSSHSKSNPPHQPFRTAKKIAIIWALDVVPKKKKKNILQGLFSASSSCSEFFCSASFSLCMRFAQRKPICYMLESESRYIFKGELGPLFAWSKRMQNSVGHIDNNNNNNTRQCTHGLTQESFAILLLPLSLPLLCAKQWVCPGTSLEKHET